MLHGQPTLLVANGPGRENARHAVASACRQFPVRTVVSTGCVGALDPQLKAGELLLIDRIIEFETGVEYSVNLVPDCESSSLAVGALITIDEVAQSVEAKARLRSTGARAVDMEASAVASEAGPRGLPFYCVRAVSDDASTGFGIDFNRTRRPNGTFSGRRVLAQAGLSWRRWKHLAALRRDAQKAFAALGEFFHHCQLTGETLR